MEKISQKIEIVRNKILIIMRFQKFLIFKLKKNGWGNLETKKLLSKLEEARIQEEQHYKNLYYLEMKLNTFISR